MSPKARGVLLFVMAAVATVVVWYGPGPRNIVGSPGGIPAPCQRMFGYCGVPRWFEYSLEGYWSDAPWLAVLGTALLLVGWRRRRRMMKFAREQDDASNGTLNGSNG